MSEHDRHTDEADIARNYDGTIGRRSAHTEQLIADARGPVQAPVDIGIRLEGEYAAALLEFERTARDLNAHQVAGPPLLERYRAALARLSAAAVK